MVVVVVVLVLLLLLLLLLPILEIRLLLLRRLVVVSCLGGRWRAGQGGIHGRNAAAPSCTEQQPCDNSSANKGEP